MAMSRPTPTRAAFERYATLEYLLIGDLRDLLEEAPDAETRRWLLAVLEELLDLLPNEFEFEDAGGYLSEVSEQFPNWSNEVDRLHHEHTQLYTTLLELRNRIANEEPFEYIASTVRSDLRRWTDAVQRHHSTEQSLMMSAFDLSYGGEG